MTIKSRIAAVVTGVALASGLALATVAPAQAVTYHVGLSKWEAYNYPDSGGVIRHWAKAGSTNHYGMWAARGGKSVQGTCWAGVTSYGFQV